MDNLTTVNIVCAMGMYTPQKDFYTNVQISFSKYFSTV